MAKTNSKAANKAKPAKGAAPKKAKASKPTKKGGGSAITGSKKDFIFKFVCEQHVMGIEEVSKVDIALAVGFKNIRSEGFSKPLKELTSVDGYLDKGTSQKDHVVLTQQGIDNMPDDLDPSAAADPTAAHDRYIEFLSKKVSKCGIDKIRAVWNILLDGQFHAVKDIANELGYCNPRSFGNTKIISSMKDMGLIEGKSSVKFTDKVRL